MLYDNGALAFIPTLPTAGTLGGQYRHTDGALMVLFAFQGGRYSDEAWDDATLRLSGDSLTIESRTNAACGLGERGVSAKTITLNCLRGRPFQTRGRGERHRFR